MNLESKIHVAGHRGLVGSALMRKLHERGYANLLTRTHAELDLTNQAAVEAFFAAEKPDYVFLAAAKVGGIHANDTYPAEFIRDNLAIQTNIIHAAYKNSVRRLLFLGSSCIYPKLAPQPLKEEHLLTGPLEPTNRPYALAKIAGIEMCWSYNRQYGTQYLAAMPTNLYGPGDNYSLMDSHVIPAMIRKFHLAKLASERNWSAIEQDEARNGPIPEDLKKLFQETCTLNLEPCIPLWGTGTPRREFMYSEDMADACLYLMNLPDAEFSKLLWPSASPPEPCPLPLEPSVSPLEPCTLDLAPVINIGVGHDLTIRELAETVAATVGYQGAIEFDATKPDGTPRKLMDVGRLNAMGWKASTVMREGLARAYRDFLASTDGQ
ncbi:GDP-L-fucose synthase family protein [Immundisolibacter cernigliae]|uniref:GDP-L-fucose synthase n=1 Tax=Immundisolibacter cernigliae TaxID=1810504 RepID=A0A1B1YQU7_9GAMM|nr:GDP-L-fucose synthase [Immundisolibacter cernigliae]ANX03092.1 GDP-fucose synthetase [Immundisolibacter cernigliae]